MSKENDVFDYNDKMLDDESIESINGGARDENGNWICPYCGEGIPGVASCADCKAHYRKCPSSPLYRP